MFNSPVLVAAPDKFRGSANAMQVTKAVALAAEYDGWLCDAAPMADGGEGSIDVLVGERRTTCVTGPLGNPISAEWTLAGEVAVIEMTRASGHLAQGNAPHDPVGATTRGTGELVAAAVDAGAHTIVVGAGGSVTTDGGLGAIDALRARLPMSRVDLIVATDVRTGFRECARVYGPQKGATESDIPVLEARLDALIERYRLEFGVDVSDLPGAGAAGGLGGGLAAIGARIVPGFSYFAELVDLESRIASADLVMTGEGKLDAQSVEGKVVAGVIDLAKKHEKPVLIVAGITDFTGIPSSFFDGGATVVSLVDTYGCERALTQTTKCIHDAVESYLQDFVR